MFGLDRQLDSLLPLLQGINKKVKTWKAFGFQALAYLLTPEYSALG